jgi:MFS family permease
MTDTGTTSKDTTGNDLRSDGAFRLIWLGTASSRLGSSVASVATPLVALEVLDASAFTISLLMAAAWIPWLLIGLPAGAWVDRRAKRPVMIASDLVAASSVLSVPFAAWLGVLTTAHLLVAAVVLGTATVFFQTAWTSYLPAVLEPRQLVPANAFLYGSESAAQVAGPGIAGLLAGAVGAVAGLLLQAGTFVVSALCLFRVRRPERRTRSPESPHLRREIVEGARFVAADRYLRNLSLHGALSNMWLTGYQALLVVFLIREVGLNAATVGLMLTLTSLGGVLGASLAPALSRRLGTARTLVLCKAGAGPCALLIPLTESGARTGLFVIGSALVITGVVAGNVVSGSFRQSYCPPHLLSRVTTSMQFVNLGTIPLGAVAAGALASVAGTRASVWVTTVGFAVSGVVLALGPLRGRRDLPAPSWEAVPQLQH